MLRGITLLSNFQFKNVQFGNLKFWFVFNFDLFNSEMLNLDMFNSHFHFLQIHMFQFPNFQISKFKNSAIQHSNNKVHRPSDIFRVPDSRIWKYIFQGCAYTCPVFKYCGNEYGVWGSRFGHIFGRCRNHLKSIAIDQESLISLFGIIKTHKNP